MKMNGDPVTAPDLVEVVAGVIREHVVGWQSDGHRSRLECDCGAEVIGGDGAVHQARAVLAALTEAGTVEWGVRNLDGPDPMWKSTDRAAVEKEVNRSPNYRTLVSRLTLPWERAE